MEVRWRSRHKQSETTSSEASLCGWSVLICTNESPPRRKTSVSSVWVQPQISTMLTFQKPNLCHRVQKKLPVLVVNMFIMIFLYIIMLIVRVWNIFRNISFQQHLYSLVITESKVLSASCRLQDNVLHQPPAEAASFFPPVLLLLRLYLPLIKLRNHRESPGFCVMWGVFIWFIWRCLTCYLTWIMDTAFIYSFPWSSVWES